MIRITFELLLLFWCSTNSFGFLSPNPSLSRAIISQRRIETKKWMADTTTSIQTTETLEEDDDDDEWEYVEFESLSEADVVKSEWLVGTNFDKTSDKIDETWCRLVTNEKGENLAIWGDNSEGKWNLDKASQYLTISKTQLWGKKIWACIVDDYYYLSGSVRSWSFISAADSIGQWQARRLGVDKDEAGIAPWFEEDDEGDEAEDGDKSPVPALTESNTSAEEPKSVF
mmetsp:Transcript_18989/g.21199  ORF Transcript_18989/g.21199 Transcript_18989/m.21199 type:complete len:228 (-) Transcript_18989:186-869(-)